MENHLNQNQQDIYSIYGLPLPRKDRTTELTNNMGNRSYLQNTEITSRQRNSSSSPPDNRLHNQHHPSQAPAILSSDSYYPYPLPSASRVHGGRMHPTTTTNRNSHTSSSTSPSKSPRYNHSHLPGPAEASNSASFTAPRSESPSTYMSVLQGEGSHMGGISAEIDVDMDLSILNAEQYRDMRYTPSEAMNNQAALRNESQHLTVAPSKARGGAGRKKRGMSDDGDSEQNGSGRASKRQNTHHDNTKQRGRPRLDTRDETAADRRRTQIRLAQRAYRLRKETTISSLKNRVNQLETSMEGMQKAFLELHDSARSVVEGEGNSNIQNMAMTLRTATEQFLALVKEAAPKPGGGSSDDDPDGEGLSGDEMSQHSNARPSMESVNNSPSSAGSPSFERSNYGPRKHQGEVVNTELGYQVSFEPEWYKQGATSDSLRNSSVTGGSSNKTTSSAGGNPPPSNLMRGFGPILFFDDLLRQSQRPQNNSMMYQQESAISSTECYAVEGQQRGETQNREGGDGSKVGPGHGQEQTLASYQSPGTNGLDLPEPFFSSRAIAIPSPLHEIKFYDNTETRYPPTPHPLPPQGYPTPEGMTMPEPDTLTYDLFNRGSFAGRVHRAAIQRAYNLLTCPGVDRKELARVFAYTFCYVTKEQAAAVVGSLVAKMDREKLRIDFDLKRDIPAPGKRVVKRSWAGDGYKLLTGLDCDKYLRPEEVEELLIERGIFVGPSSRSVHSPSKKVSMSTISDQEFIDMEIAKVEAAERSNKIQSDGLAYFRETLSGAQILDETGSDSGISTSSPRSAVASSSPEYLSPASAYENLRTNATSSPAAGPPSPYPESYTTTSSKSASNFESNSGYSSNVPGSPSPPPVAQPKQNVNLDRLIEELIYSGICLGKSPGFKMVDIERAIEIASSAPTSYLSGSGDSYAADKAMGDTNVEIPSASSSFLDSSCLKNLTGHQLEQINTSYRGVAPTGQSSVTNNWNKRNISGGQEMHGGGGSVHLNTALWTADNQPVY